MGKTTVRAIKREEVERQDTRYEERHQDVAAVIKSVNGYTRPPTQQNMTWVSILNQPESRTLVFNATTLSVEGTPVWVGPMAKPPYRWEVKGIYFGAMTQQQSVDYSRATIGAHATNHQVPTESTPGADPLTVYQPMWNPLRTQGDGSSLSVTTFPQIYFVGTRRVYFAGQVTDLTSSVPGTANTKRKVLVYLDEETNVGDTVDGQIVSTLSSSPAPYPDIPINGRPSAYVELTNGQTAITTATHIEDSRDIGRGRHDYSNEYFGGILKDYSYETEIDATATGTVTIDYHDSNVHDITLTGNTTLVIANPPPAGLGGELFLIVRQDSTGSRTMTWPINIWWPSSTAATITAAANGVDFYAFFTLDAGATYIARTLAQNVGPAPQTVSFGTLALASSAETMVVAPVTNILVDTLTLVSSAESMSVFTVVNVAVNTLVLAGSAETITAIELSQFVSVDTLVLAGSAETIDIAGGTRTVTVDTLILAGSTHFGEVGA